MTCLYHFPSHRKYYVNFTVNLKVIRISKPNKINESICIISKKKRKNLKEYERMNILFFFSYDTETCHQWEILSLFYFLSRILKLCLFSIQKLKYFQSLTHIHTSKSDDLVLSQRMKFTMSITFNVIEAEQVH